MVQSLIWGFLLQLSSNRDTKSKQSLTCQTFEGKLGWPNLPLPTAIFAYTCWWLLPRSVEKWWSVFRLKLMKYRKFECMVLDMTDLAWRNVNCRSSSGDCVAKHKETIRKIKSGHFIWHKLFEWLKLKWQLFLVLPTTTNQERHHTIVLVTCIAYYSYC